MKAGIGAHCDGILKLSQNYRRILVMFRLAERVEEKVLEYDELGVKKLLMSINDNEVISSYEEEILGKLKKYDAENNTNLMDLLRKYLECDGSIQQVVKEMYIHRNTVNYQIKKIKNILGCDMHSLEEKLQLLLAFHVHDIL